jgi:hypothetical protein
MAVDMVSHDALNHAQETVDHMQAHDRRRIVRYGRRVRLFFHRWGDGFNRAALLVLVLLYLLGFNGQRHFNDRITESRIAGTRDSCAAINANADAIRALIVKGAKSSKPFDPIYKQYGFPPYKERVRLAMRDAATVEGQNCKARVEQIRREASK